MSAVLRKRVDTRKKKDDISNANEKVAKVQDFIWTSLLSDDSVASFLQSFSFSEFRLKMKPFCSIFSCYY